MSVQGMSITLKLEQAIDRQVMRKSGEEKLGKECGETGSCATLLPARKRTAAQIMKYTVRNE